MLLSKRAFVGVLLSASAAVLAISGMAIAGGGALSLRLSGVAATPGSARVTLSRDVPRLAGQAGVKQAPVTAAQQVRVAIFVRDPHAAAEQTLYRAVYAKGSPDYHHFLTPAEYASRFGATPAARNAIASWLERGGLRVAYSGGTGYYWVATGSAAQVSALFQVTLRNYTAGGRTFYANATAPTVPAGLGIEAVSLTDGLTVHTDQDVPNPTFNAAPADLWSIYGMPSSDTGQGEQLGILGVGYVANSDPTKDALTLALRDFEANNKLPQVPLRIIPTSGPVTADSGGLGEWELDTQASSGMAPGALDIDFYDGASSSLTDLAAEIGFWAQDANGPHQASASLGACEDNPAFDAIGAEYAKAMTAAELQAVNEGRTLFASTGDTGSGCIVGLPVNVNGVVISPVTMPEMPAAIPYTVAVGGTVLYPQLRSFAGQTISDPNAPRHRALEYSWTHGGGGASRYVAAPDYQQSTANVNIPCTYGDSAGDPPSGVTTCRGVPDVAAMSGDVVSDGYTISDRSGACSPAPCTVTTGGTSLSSPLWLGMWTRVQAAATTPNNQGLGFADKLIYQVGNDATRYANDFFDVQAGANGAYHAAPGWDYTTGWGVPIVDAFAKDLTGNTTLTPTHPTTVLPPLPGSGGGGTGGGGGSGPPITAAACTPLWNDAAGDDTFLGNQPVSLSPPPDQGSNPQLDLLTSSLSLSPDGKTLRTRLVLDNLSTTVPSYSQANIYFGIFTFNGTQYYAGAEVDPTGGVYYGYGTDSGGSITPVGTATGSLKLGPRGVVEIDVPLADFGNPGVGASLTATGAQTFVLSGTNGDTAGQVPANPVLNAGALDGFGSYETVDSSPTDASGNFTGRTYQVAEICAPPVGTGISISTRVKRPWSGYVATFRDPRASDVASEFQALINWGDGTTSLGTVTVVNGVFTVVGRHVWSRSGTYTVKVTLTQTDDPSRPPGTATSTATIKR